jgi:hypothetical protein
LLPKLQESLPVEAAYKKEVPGLDSDLGVYDVVYYAGDCNSEVKQSQSTFRTIPRFTLKRKQKVAVKKCHEVQIRSNFTSYR